MLSYSNGNPGGLCNDIIFEVAKFIKKTEVIGLLSITRDPVAGDDEMVKLFGQSYIDFVYHNNGPARIYKDIPKYIVRDIINGRRKIDPILEKKIMESPKHLIKLMKKYFVAPLITSPVEEIKKAVLKDVKVASEYYKITKSMMIWPEYEPLIRKFPEYIIFYCKRTGMPWPYIEDLKDITNEDAIYYAKNILRRPFPEDHVLHKLIYDSMYLSDYALLFNEHNQELFAALLNRVMFTTAKIYIEKFLSNDEDLDKAILGCDLDSIHLVYLGGMIGKRKVIEDKLIESGRHIDLVRYAQNLGHRWERCEKIIAKDPTGMIEYCKQFGQVFTDQEVFDCLNGLPQYINKYASQVIKGQYDGPILSPFNVHLDPNPLVNIPVTLLPFSNGYYTMRFSS